MTSYASSRSIMVATMILIPGLVSQDLDPTQLASQCLFDDVYQCKRVSDELKEHCDCPCLPKCCPPDHHVITSPDARHHGIECVESPEALALPRVNIVGHVNESESEPKPRFYHSVLPFCRGFASSEWDFDVYDSDQVRVQTDYAEEYVLFLNVSHYEEHQKVRKIILNNENSAEKTQDDGHLFNNVMVGSRPLMYFCFDNMNPTRDSSEAFKTVAITCPRAPMAEKAKIPKCCPFGEAFNVQGECHPSGHESDFWYLPINGHLYHESELRDLGILQFHQSRSYAFPSTAFQTCEELPDRTLFKDSDDFHIGPNGKVHFTDAHGHVDKLQDYCVDQYYKKPLASSDTSQYLSDYVYYDYGNETTEEIEEDRELKMLANHDCHKMDSKPHSMDIMYCKDNIIQIRKCCPKGTILNLRSRACTNEVQKEWGEFIIYRKIGGEFDPFPSNHTNLFPSVIFNMNTKNLYVTESDDYKLLNDESLFYGGKFYHPGQYCLDYSINYCESGSTNLTIRAIVDDALLRQKGASTIFGTNKEDSRISLIIKQVGYPLSIAALILTLLTFLVVPDLRKDLHGKMVISIVVSQTVVFSCLLVGTITSSSVSRNNFKCIFQAVVTYFCILCGFMWMSAMSYNIMTKFRASTVLPKDADGRRFLVYGSFCIGLPLILTIIVLILDRNVTGTSWRPGFGEESCWFSSCSSALTYFLYCPICVLLLSNVLLFVYAAVKLSNMQKRIRGPSRNQSCERSSGGAVERGAFIRQVSLVSNNATLVKTKSKIKGHQENLCTYFKLFVVMGLTWVFEVIAWILSEESLSAPEPIIILLNIINIGQGIVMFVVFTLKTTTLQKLKDQFRSKTQRTSSNVRQTAGSRDTVTRGGSSLASNVSYNFDRAALKLNGQLTRASSLDSDMPVVDLNE